MVEQKVTEILAKKFQEEGYSNFFLVEVVLTKNKLEVFIDSDTGINLSQCQEFSRYIESFIEEEQWLPEDYTIEVSSPGLSRPLTMERQYKKNIGRQLAIELKEGTKKEGILLSADESTCSLEENIVIQEGNKKKKGVIATAIPYNTIKKAVIKPVFK